MKLFSLTTSISLAIAAELKRQSPIDLPVNITTIPNLGNYSIELDSAPAVVRDETHTIKALWNAGPNSHLTLNGHIYNSVQFHFHSPSEHTIGGKQYPFEVHFVHSDKESNLAVVGILFDIDPNDKPNKFLNQVWEGFGALHEQGDNYTVSKVDPSSLRIDQSNVYRYPGSLTTPPYTEGVEWTVLQKVHWISNSQLKAWKSVIEEPNAREVQNLYGRKVVLLNQPGKPAC